MVVFKMKGKKTKEIKDLKDYCNSCKKREKCKGLCETAKKFVNQDYVSQEEMYLSFEPSNEYLEKLKKLAEGSKESEPITDETFEEIETILFCKGGFTETQFDVFHMYFIQRLRGGFAYHS
jgi:hypothetical protein